jgi:hypothetical protein
MGLDRVVRHRQQAHAGLPPTAERRGDGGQRLAVRQQLAAPDVGREVLVAEREPVRAGLVGGELGPDAMRLRVPPPALVLVDAAAQGVHDGVQVRADAQAEQRDVVARVPDHGDLGLGRGPAQAAKKTGGTHATREHGNAHNCRVWQVPWPAPAAPRRPPRPPPTTVTASNRCVTHLLTVRNLLDSLSYLSRISDNEGTTITFSA